MGLWKALDSDNSGSTSLQEFDLRTAERLAKFKEFVEQLGGAVRAFKSLDIGGSGKIGEAEFVNACQSHGFQKINKALFDGLAWRGNNFIIEDDLRFLDSWKCPAYLTSKANDQAAKQFKAALLKTYGTYVKAWRTCLDVDSSNNVAWHEFHGAASRIKFNGDIAGAWRALDNDVSGFITLSEID